MLLFYDIDWAMKDTRSTCQKQVYRFTTTQILSTASGTATIISERTFKADNRQRQTTRLRICGVKTRTALIVAVDGAAP